MRKTQREAARELGMSDASISRRLTGKIRMGKVELKRVAEALGVSASSLRRGIALRRSKT